MIRLKYQPLIEHYIEKAEEHGYQYLFGPKNEKPYHKSQERNFDMLLIYTVCCMVKELSCPTK